MRKKQRLYWKKIGWNVLLVTAGRGKKYAKIKKIAGQINKKRPPYTAAL